MKNVSLEIGANPPHERKSLTIPEIDDNFNVSKIYIDINEFRVSPKKKFCLD